LCGVAFERTVLEEAGIAEADALVAVTSGDNTNIVVARIAKDVYRVPDVVARIYDPRRADIYRRYGIQTFAPTAWSAGKIVEFIVSPNLEREESFGNGEVQMLAAWVPEHLVGKPVNDLRVPGEIRVALIVRMGRGLIPVSGTRFEVDDQVHVVVHQTAVEKFEKMMGWKT
jgi:trk system potassium uptake protein TrkA